MLTYLHMEQVGDQYCMLLTTNSTGGRRHIPFAPLSSARKVLLKVSYLARNDLFIRQSAFFLIVYRLTSTGITTPGLSIEPRWVANWTELSGVDSGNV